MSLTLKPEPWMEGTGFEPSPLGNTHLLFSVGIWGNFRRRWGAADGKAAHIFNFPFNHTILNYK